MSAQSLRDIRPAPAAKRAGRSAAAKRPLAALPLDQIIRGDCISTMAGLPEGWVDLVFADPPFNIGYKYHDYHDRKSVEDYLEFSRRWMAGVFRALKPGGTFYLAIGDEFAADLCTIARRELGFTMRNWIIWHYTFGQQTKKMFAKSHTHIFYFVKPGAEYTFNADAVRIPSARQKIYDDVRANPKGKLPDDTWTLKELSHFRVDGPPGGKDDWEEFVHRPQEADGAAFSGDSDTWHVSRVCGTFKEREGWHGCQMPLEILKRIITASSNEGQIVLDPFSGSGTTAVSAYMLGRRYVGIEQSAEYAKHAESRLEHARVAKSSGDLDGVTDKGRKSRKTGDTDAMGRKRVPRKPGAAR